MPPSFRAQPAQVHCEPEIDMLFFSTLVDGILIIRRKLPHTQHTTLEDNEGLLTEHLHGPHANLQRTALSMVSWQEAGMNVTDLFLAIKSTQGIPSPLVSTATEARHPTPGRHLELHERSQTTEGPRQDRGTWQPALASSSRLSLSSHRRETCAKLRS
jgi:hypothetical protein